MSYTYIKKDKGYVEFENKFNPNINENLGLTYQDYLDNKWVMLNDQQKEFHINNPYASVEEVFNLEISSQSIEKYLNVLKEHKIKEIEKYDNSDEVNSFTINGQKMWLTVNDRQKLSSQISAFETLGRESMTKWFNGQNYTFAISQWKQMLAQLEVYAGDALNVTELHKVNINNFNTVEEIKNYDITQGYPEKLVF